MRPIVYAFHESVLLNICLTRSRKGLGRWKKDLAAKRRKRRKRRKKEIRKEIEKLKESSPKTLEGIIL